MAEPEDLDRFIEAQARVYGQVCAELRAGAKQTHWMWFVFPQLRGLGRSPVAQHFALESLAEARAYWAHPLLGPRLSDCTELVLAVSARTAQQIFGSPDDMKFRSCLTLFDEVTTGAGPFDKALTRFYGGAKDPLTLRLLAEAGEDD